MSSGRQPEKKPILDIPPRYNDPLSNAFSKERDAHRKGWVDARGEEAPPTNPTPAPEVF